MFNKFKIKSVFIINLVLMGIIILVYCAFILYSTKSSLETNLITRGQTEIATLIKIQVDNHINKEIFSELDFTKTQKTFEDFFEEIDTAEVLRIKVWNKNAVIIAANDPNIIGKTFSDNKRFQEAIKGEVTVEIKTPLDSENVKETGYKQLMEVYVPIKLSSGEIVGVIETYTILDNLNQQILDSQEKLITLFLAVSLPLLCLFGLMFNLLYRGVYFKINKLTDFISTLKTGKLGNKIDIEFKDELSEIAVAINEMSAELQVKVNELKELNKIMIDRELKMIELKKENTALREELQKEANK